MVLLVVLATVLVVALGRVVGASPRAAVPDILRPPSPVTSPPQAQTDPALARTAAGMVRGVVESDHRLFAGIPYAAPPVGPLRFQPPAPAPAWTGMRDATEPGPRCIQDPGGDPEFGRQSDEDCLTLNVWTPASTGSPRPVMVWIHGGSFTGGSGNIYDARWLVVARRHHRRHHQLPARHARVPGSSCAGAARRRRQLRTAGPAGGAALGPRQHRQLRRRPGQGHRRRCNRPAACRCATTWSRRARRDCSARRSSRARRVRPRPTCRRPNKSSLDYAARAGCGDPKTAADCLRALPVDKLREPVTFYNIGQDALPGPVTGTAVLPVDPVTAIAENDAARVPVLMGTNRDEFTLFVALQYLRIGKDYTAEQYPGSAARNIRRQRRCRRRALSAEQLRRQCARGVFGGGHRRGVRLRERADE